MGLDPRRKPAFSALAFESREGQPFTGHKRKFYLQSLAKDVSESVPVCSQMTSFEAEYARRVRQVEMVLYEPWQSKMMNLMGYHQIGSSKAARLADMVRWDHTG